MKIFSSIDVLLSYITKKLKGCFSEYEQESTTVSHEIEEKDIESIQKGLYEWISRELILFSQRMGWVLTINAFLVAPIMFALREDGKFPPSALPYLMVICIVGFILTISLTIPLDIALKTINNLRKREKLISNIFPQKSKIFLLIDPEKSYNFISDWPVRESCSHEISMGLQLLIPKFIICFWFLLFFYILIISLK
jgi:hypothetical protein